MSQPRYQSQYKPLLLHGFATWGFVYRYFSSGGGEDYEFAASYAWFDARGELQFRHLSGSYDGMHAALGKGMGDIVVDTDAEFSEGLEIVILQDPRTEEHIPYRALRAEPGLDKPPPPPFEPVPPFGLDEDRLEPPGTFWLEWEGSGQARSARLVRTGGERPEALFKVQRAGRPARAWVLTRPGRIAPFFSALLRPAPGGSVSFHLRNPAGVQAGTVTEEAGKFRLAVFGPEGPRNFYTGSGDSTEKRTLLEEMHEALTLEQTESADREVVELHVPTRRCILELSILGLLAARHESQEQQAAG